MRILALETIGETASVAILDDAHVLAFEEGSNLTTQSEFLLPAVQRILERSNTPLTALAGIAVCRGVGSFTGIRIGLSAAAGLALPLGLPVVGVSAFEVAEYITRPRKTPVAVLVQSQNNVYLQIFTATGEPVGDAVLTTIEAFPALLPTEPFMKAGNGWVGEIIGNVDAVSVGRTALPFFVNLKCGEFPQALYIKQSYAAL